MAIKKAMAIFTIALASTAIFSLALHKGSPKPFDAIFLALVLVTFAQWKTWKDIYAFWPRIKPYAMYVALIFLFIALGTVLNFEENIEHIGGRGLAVNFVRVLFNAAVFLFFAFLVSSREKLLPWASIGLLASFALSIPAYWNIDEGVFIDGGRLKGFSQGPLIFGFLSTIGFLVAIGLLINSKRFWSKAVFAASVVAIANLNLWAASRATWIAVAVGLVLSFAFSRRSILDKLKYFAVFPAMAFFLGWVFLPSSPALTIRQWVGERAVNLVASPVHEGQTRIQAWSAASTAILENPLGLGFERRFLSSGTFFEVALFGGIGALVFFAAIFFRILKEASVAARNLAGDRFADLKLAWVMAGVAVIAAIFFADAFLWRQTWALLGISLGAVWSRPVSRPLRFSRDDNAGGISVQS